MTGTAHTPVLIKRRCGGWLAVTRRSYPLQIGVTGSDVFETRMRFYRHLRAWLKIHRRKGAA